MTLSHFCCGNSMEIHSRVLCSSSKASELLTRVAQQQQQTQDAWWWAADMLMCAHFWVLLSWYIRAHFPDSSHMSQWFSLGIPHWFQELAGIHLCFTILCTYIMCTGYIYICIDISCKLYAHMCIMFMYF